jgi:hypothetical protein
MRPYHVYLAELGHARIDRAAIAQRLLEYFKRVVELANATPYSPNYYSRVIIRWVDAPPAMQPDELLVYFVEDWGHSVVRHAPGNTLFDLGTGGTTRTGSPAASEVYITENPSIGVPYLRNPEVLAAVAFHECLHNKLDFDDALHAYSLGRAAGGIGLAAASVGPQTPLTHQNVEMMAAALSSPRPQWTGGWLAYRIEVPRFLSDWARDMRQLEIDFAGW